MADQIVDHRLVEAASEEKAVEELGGVVTCVPRRCNCLVYVEKVPSVLRQTSCECSGAAVSVSMDCSSNDGGCKLNPEVQLAALNLSIQGQES